MSKVNCIACDIPEPATYIRYTQFAGDHPLCEKHAREDKNFMEFDSYTFWEAIEDE